MCYRISNTATIDVIEETFNATFKFPKLYKEANVIDGLLESSVSIITMKNNSEISLAIWGLLPETLEDDWQHFQNVQNTLNVDVETMSTDPKYKDALRDRRCIILVTGFFTYYLYNGNLYPYYVHISANKPFAIAGVFNVLDDGFITCSIVVSKANNFIEQIHNTAIQMPVVLGDQAKSDWLTKTIDEGSLQGIIDNPSNLKLKAYPIAKEFHKIGVDFESALERVSYDGIPEVKK